MDHALFEIMSFNNSLIVSNYQNLSCCFIVQLSKTRPSWMNFQLEILFFYFETYLKTMKLLFILSNSNIYTNFQNDKFPLWLSLENRVNSEIVFLIFLYWDYQASMKDLILSDSIWMKKKEVYCWTSHWFID